MPLCTDSLKKCPWVLTHTTLCPCVLTHSRNTLECWLTQHYALVIRLTQEMPLSADSHNTMPFVIRLKKCPWVLIHTTLCPCVLTHSRNTLECWLTQHYALVIRLTQEMPLSADSHNTMPFVIRLKKCPWVLTHTHNKYPIVSADSHYTTCKCPWALIKQYLKAFLLATQLVSFPTWKNHLCPQVLEQVVTSVTKRAEVGISPGAQTKHRIPAQTH